MKCTIYSLYYLMYIKIYIDYDVFGNKLFTVYCAIYYLLFYNILEYSIISQKTPKY